MTKNRVRRPVRAWSQLTDGAVLRERVRQEHATGWTSRRIAENLNATGHRTPWGKPFTAASVRQLRTRGDPQVINGRRRRPKKKRKRAAAAAVPH